MFRSSAKSTSDLPSARDIRDHPRLLESGGVSLISAERQPIGRGEVELVNFAMPVLTIVTSKKLVINTCAGLTL